MADDREHITFASRPPPVLREPARQPGMAFIQQTFKANIWSIAWKPSSSSVKFRPTNPAEITTVLLDQAQHPEIRAGAAWALGELQQPSSVDALIQVFLELAEPIRIEAARALRKIAATTDANVAARLPAANNDQRAGIAWAVSHSGRVKIDELLPLLVDDDARRWVAYILGTQDQQACIGQIEQLRRRDPEVYFAVTVLWKILASWVYDLEGY